MIRVSVADPSAYTPPYDHALCRALAAAGAEVELATSRFAYGSVPAAAGYTVSERFYRRELGTPGSVLRRSAKLVQHVPDMLAYRRHTQGRADVVHFQWLTVPWLDGALLPRGPLVLTAHDLLPREPRPGQAAAQRRLLARMDAVIVHSQYGRRRLIDGLGLDPGRVHVIPHGSFDYLSALPADPLAPDLAAVREPVVLFFGLLRPYKGIATLLEAWRGITGAELWVVGRPRMDLGALQAQAPPGVRFVPRFVGDGELAGLFRRADVVVLPYARTERFDQSGVLATALAFGRPTVITDIGGFGEVAAAGGARLVAPDDPAALHAALAELVTDPAARARLADGALAAAQGPYSWAAAARATLALYATLV